MWTKYSQLKKNILILVVWTLELRYVFLAACGPECQLLCLNMHNYYRDLHGSPPLECDPELAKSAQEWTDEQAAKGYMHHSESTVKLMESISWKGRGWEWTKWREPYQRR